MSRLTFKKSNKAETPKLKLKFKSKESKESKEDNSSFNYYPDIEDVDFYGKLWSKQEFIENKSSKPEYYDDSERKKKLLKKLCSPDVMKLKNHQIFLRNYLSPETPYNSILVFHGVGSGKTCASVIVAEGLKEMAAKYNKKIYVIADGLIRGNFRDTLYNMGDKERNSKYPGSLQCTKTTYYIPPKPKESPDERKHREKAIREMQKKYYEYMGYISFVHFVDKIEKEHDLGEYFSNSIFIIDEAHNLIARSGTKSKIGESTKTREKLHEIFKVANNTKLVLLTATPITNEIDDIVILVNLLRANDKRAIIPANKLSTDGSSKLTKENLDVAKFSEFVKGYISYIRGAHPSSFPKEILMNTYYRKILYDMYGDELKDKIPNFKELGLVECEMSEFHFYNYFKHNMKLERNSIGGKTRETWGDQLTIQAATVMYPLEDKDDMRLGNYEIEDVFIKEKIKGRIEKYKYKTKEQFLDVESRNEKYLHIDNKYPTIGSTIGYPLAKYSVKFYHMLYDIVNNVGINFIFTRYKTNVGTIPIGLLLEQNGYVRYHRNLGKPNEITGKYREGVSNHLDIRNNKYRCICGYLDVEHDKDYNGVNDYSKPLKHRFLQGTYIRVDGETSDDFDQYYRNIINSRGNKYGELIKILIGGENMREGVDLKYVRSVHIMNPWHNLIQIEQTIGRAIRLCSHADLDKTDEMTVSVYKYVSIPPRDKMSKTYSLLGAIKSMEDAGELELDGVKFRDRKLWLENVTSNNPSEWESVDEYIYARALNKDYNIKFAERLLKKASVDCYLNLEANVNFPGDKNGTRVCDYQDCDYKCNYQFSGVNKANLDTYDLYFMEPKVQNAQEVISDLFTRNWGLTLESIVDLAQKHSSDLSRDVIYLALDRILGDPPLIKPLPVIDKYGRNGYIIYRHPYYIYQPKEVADENLPAYNRMVPGRGKKLEIDLKSLIQPTKKQIIMKKPLFKESPSDRLGNVPSPKSETDKTTSIQMIQSKFGSQIESILAPIQNQSELVISSVLDYMTKKEHEYLIRTRIEEWCKNYDKNEGIFIKRILSYYMENYLLAHPKMTYDENDNVKNIPKSNVNWVYNLSGIFWLYDSANEKWIEVHEDSKVMEEIKKRQESADGPSFAPLNRELSNDVYGYMYDDNKKREIKFKITYIGGQQVKTKRYSEEINIKTLHRGQVCGNYSNEQLENLCIRLGLKYDENLQRTSLCSIIENELRKRDKTDKKEMWFMNFFQYKRKMNKMEDTDLRSLYTFYQNQ